jgi:hypothetical protein
LENRLVLACLPIAYREGAKSKRAAWPGLFFKSPLIPESSDFTASSVSPRLPIGLLNIDQSRSSRENASTSQLEEESCFDPKTMIDFEHLF